MTAHYLHLPGVGTGPLFPRLAAAVAPGGTLLIVGHLLDAADGHGHDHRGHDHDHRGHGHDHGGHAHDHGGHGHDHRGHAHNHGGHAHDPDMFFTAEDIAASLEAGEWTDVVTETRERASAAIERTGNPAPDTVLRARRRASGAR